MSIKAGSLGDKSGFMTINIKCRTNLIATHLHASAAPEMTLSTASWVKFFAAAVFMLVHEIDRSE